jgi:hypothetical protein
MSKESEGYDQVVSKLKQVRDELALKAHLGKAEAKDEWARLEQEWKSVQGKLKEAQGVAGDTAKNLGTAVELAAKELKAGYDRFRGLL